MTINFFTRTEGQKAIEYHQLKLIVYDIQKEVIVKWLNLLEHYANLVASDDEIEVEMIFDKY